MRRVYSAAYFLQVSLSVLLQPSYGVDTIGTTSAVLWNRLDTWFTEIMRTNSGVHKSRASVRVTKFFTVELHIFVVLSLDLAECHSSGA